MDLQLAEILVPGLKQFKSGKTNEGLIWLIGSVVGYLMGFMPGIIIHGIYIWKYFGNKIMTTISGTASPSNGAVPNDTLMEPSNYSATKQRGFNFGLSQNCRSCGAKLILMEQGSKSGTCGKCELAARGLLDSNEQVLFHQGASYRGGLQGYPNAAKKNGFAFVFDNSFAFYDNDIAWKIPYERVTEVSLDSFKPSGTRAVLAGVNARMLQEIQNIIALSYLDDDSIERIAKFQIHGALSIPGEAAKAGEFINHLLEFKKKFSSKVANNSSDPAVKLEKLKKLKEQGIISDSEFEAKKRELLDQL